MTKKQKLEMVLNGTVVIPRESLEMALFFVKKYKGAPFFSEKSRLRLRPDLVKLCEVFFNDPGFVVFIDILRAAQEATRSNHLSCMRGLEATCSFVRLMDKFGWFYELNKDTSHGITDKRAHLFVELKNEFIRGLPFLMQRTSPRPPMKRPTRRRIVWFD